MNGGRTRRWLTAVTAVGLLATAAGCAKDDIEPAAATAGFDTTAAKTVLGVFDTADSAASAAGDESALRAQETEPAVLFSIAAARSAKASGRKQPGFQHLRPAFAIPPGDACLIASSALKLAGEELEYRDVLVMVKGGEGGWKLSHHVLLGQETPPAAVAVEPVGVPTAETVPPARQEQLAKELFTRTMGRSAGGSPDASVDQNPLLDKRLAGGWTIYNQQLGAAGLTVQRSFGGFTAAPCAAKAGGRTLLFLTITLTDTVTAVPGGGTPASLPPTSPDAVALNLPQGLSGTTLTVTRTEVFLLSVPAAGAGPSTVLGLNDVATKAVAS